MQKVTLGKDGPKVARLAVACGGLTGATAAPSLEQALDAGLNLIDTWCPDAAADVEGHVGRALKGRRKEVVLMGGFSGRHFGPDRVAEACDRTLQRLGVDSLDVWIQHELNAAVAIEDSVSAMARLVQAGKVRHLGLRDASWATIRRAHAVHALSAVQLEYALWCRDVEDELLATLRGLNIALIARRPLGRGFLTGASVPPPKGDGRFAGEAQANNQALLGVLAQVAQRIKASPAHVALAWLLAQGNDVVPLFGARLPEQVQHNVQALQLRLTPPMLDKLDLTFHQQATQGTAGTLLV